MSPVVSVSFLRFPPLGGALTGSQAHCEAIPHGQDSQSGDCREFGDDQRCWRSNQSVPSSTVEHSNQLNAVTCLPSIWRWNLSDCGPPGLGLERNRSCQTRHDAGRSAMNRSGCSLQACRTPHAASVLPLRTCYGGGVFHAEAGDLMGQFGTRPSLR